MEDNNKVFKPRNLMLFMDIELALKEYGLTEKETKVYLALLPLGSINLQEIAKKVDFPRTIEQSPALVNYNRNLAQKYGVQGFPTIVLLDKNGSVLTYTGYREGGAQSYVEHIRSFIM